MLNRKNEKTDRNKTNSFLILTLLGSAAVFMSAYPNNLKTEPNLSTQPVVIDWLPKADTNAFSIIKKPTKIKNKTDLYRYMKNSNVKFPELVWSQAMAESAFMSSGLFNRSNNLFGMTKSESRPNVQIHIKGERYSHFESIRKCVIDYTLHQDFVLKVGNIKTESEYIRKLESTGYAADKKYRKKLLAIRENTDFESMLLE